MYHETHDCIVKTNGTKKPSAKPGTKGRWPKGKANRMPRA